MDVGGLSDEDVASSMLKALSNMTYDSIVNKTLAGRADGVPATLALMDGPFSGSAMVVEDTCRVLRNLADGVVANHACMMKSRAIPITMEMLNRHGPSSAGVAEHGIALFVNLAGPIREQSRLDCADIVALAQRLSLSHLKNDRVTHQVQILTQLLRRPRDGDGSGRRRGSRSRSPLQKDRVPRSNSDSRTHRQRLRSASGGR